ncbi:hypothetical protein AVEN_112530-1 [Araneus ventricosus]|uniref:Uncharacterized protein n=1 Tax=Araneus ventricosus TaxID=182803 RepID=A0A4Y2QAA5_ARAVE|nr:hypothetical protein AVEN_112530-1 [Araneus ventricosus]
MKVKISTLRKRRNPDSNFRESLTWQECKLETSYCKRLSHHALNLQQACCIKHIANYSKIKVRRDEPQIQTPNNPLPKPVAVTTKSAGTQLRKKDCADRSCIYMFYFKLSS